MKRLALVLSAVAFVISAATASQSIGELVAKAHAGDAEAQYSLGARYAQGDGVAKDEVEAVNWYRKAAEQGHASAQFSLGAAYARGQGVPRDYAEDVNWRRKAAEQGHASAQFSLGAAYALGQGVPKDLAAAVAWCRKAAEQGHARAQFVLGIFYRDGKEVAKSGIEAYALFNLAAMTLEEAKEPRNALEKTLSRDEIAAAQKRSREIQKEIDARLRAGREPVGKSP